MWGRKKEIGGLGRERQGRAGIGKRFEKDLGWGGNLSISLRVVPLHTARGVRAKQKSTRNDRYIFWTRKRDFGRSGRRPPEFRPERLCSECPGNKQRLPLYKKYIRGGIRASRSRKPQSTIQVDDGERRKKKRKETQKHHRRSTHPCNMFSLWLSILVLFLFLPSRFGPTLGLQIKSFKAASLAVPLFASCVAAALAVSPCAPQLPSTTSQKPAP